MKVEIPDTRPALIRALGITDAEIAGVALAARKLRDDPALLWPLLVLLRRLTSESDGGIAGVVLAEFARACTHTLTYSIEMPDTFECALCGRWATD